MYVPLRGEELIRSLVFKQRSVTWDNFGAGRANQSYLLHLPSYARNVTCTNVIHNAAVKNSASKVGTFTCRTFPRDTKASKRAKHSQVDKVSFQKKTIFNDSQTIKFSIV